MDNEAWLKTWVDGQIGFNQAQPSATLQKYWPALEVARDARVFVPLCGKSIDMVWLAGQGHHILGVELSPIAIAQFFDERGLKAETHRSRHGTHHVAGAFELICGDVFGISAEVLAGCGAVYDRAALIALPPPLRAKYVRDVYGRLPAGCRGLLLTLDYPQAEMEGPPFSVPEHEVRDLFETRWDVDLLEVRDALPSEPHFKDRGLTRLAAAAYRLRCRGISAE
jgi:thiopurine S-methyltransferase